MIKLLRTDGGKQHEGFDNEYNDCAVRALALSTGIMYAKAHGLLKAEGRQDRKDTKFLQIERALAALYSESAIASFEEIAIAYTQNIFAKPIVLHYPTLEETIRKYRTGRYLVITTGHALALIDGVVHDKGQISGPRSRAQYAFKITLAEPDTSPALPDQAQINELWARLDKLEGKL